MGQTKKTQIVVVGGGAGGLELVSRLGKKLGRKKFDVVLVDKNPTHIWKPLLHEVAAGSLDANLDEVGYRAHAHRNGFRFFLGTMQSINRDDREIVLAPIEDEDGSIIMDEHRIRYDYLVLAVGSVSNSFGTRGVEQHCLMLDTRAEADRFRQKLLNHCLRVSRTMTSKPASDEHVRVAIVGGGATGVELAAELYNSAAELRHYGLEVFDESRLQVTLIEAGPRILPALPKKLAAAAEEELTALGVRVISNEPVVEATSDGMLTRGGEHIPADIRVWAAGVKGPDYLQGIAGLETNRNNRLIVTRTLQSTLDPTIYAIGDCACVMMPGAKLPVPPRAQAAHQMADTVYDNILRDIAGKSPREFRYTDHGSLVSLSRFSTVGSLMGNLVGGRMAVEGRLARMVYVSLYRMHLLAVHGWLKGACLIVVSAVNKVIRPRLKLH
ncbi:MAG: NAD(P)/FAD-dependent oxidoreductase [Pseudomonadota bacterium]